MIEQVVKAWLISLFVGLLVACMVGLFFAGSPSKSIEREEGLRAERAGLTASDNPYTGQQKVAWLNGYIDGREARMKRLGLLHSDE